MQIALKETSHQSRILVSVLIKMSVLKTIERGENAEKRLPTDGENQNWACKEMTYSHGECCSLLPSAGTDEMTSTLADA